MKPSTRPSNTTQQLAASAYFVGFLLVAIPIFDALMSVAPFHPDRAQWRFAALGLLSNALMIPSVGMLIAVVAAVTLDHFGVMRALRVFSWLAIVVILGSIGVFALDSMQTRSGVRPEMHLSFLVASVTAICKMLLGVVAFGLFARASRASSRRVAGPATASNLLVSRDVAAVR